MYFKILRVTNKRIEIESETFKPGVGNKGL